MQHIYVSRETRVITQSNTSVTHIIIERKQLFVNDFCNKKYLCYIVLQHRYNKLATTYII